MDVSFDAARRMWHIVKASPTRFAAVLAVLCAFGLGVPAAICSGTGEQDREIAEAVRNLGHADYTVREKATMSLWMRGDTAVDALRKARETDDPEISIRAGALLNKILRGIVPGAPEATVKLIESYFDARDANEKTRILRRLEADAAEPVKAVVRLTRGEKNPLILYGAYELLARRFQGGGDFFIEEAELQDALLAILDAGVASDRYTASRALALSVFLFDRLDSEIAAREALVSNGRRAAAIPLAFIYRMKGDLAKAAAAADTAGDPYLKYELLWEDGNWKGALERYAGDEEGQNVESLGIKAALARLSGDVQGAGKLMNRVAELGGNRPQETWQAAEAALVNNDPDRAEDIFIGARLYGTAAQLFDCRLKYDALRRIATNVVREADSLSAGAGETALLWKAIAAQVLEDGDGPWLDRIPEIVFSDYEPEYREEETASALGLYKQAKKEIAEGNEEKGKALFRRASAIPFLDEAARFNLVWKLKLAGEDAAAEREFRIAVGSAEFHSWHSDQLLRSFGARTAVEKGDFAAALKCRQRAFLALLHANTGFTDVRAYLFEAQDIAMLEARVALDGGRAEEAVAKAKEGMRLVPHRIEVAHEFVLALRKKGLADAADGFFDSVFDPLAAAAAAMPRIHWVRNNAGWFAAICKRRLPEAMKLMEQALDLRPKNWQYMDTLAELLFQSGNREKAIELEKTALGLSPDSKFLKQQIERFEKGDPAAELPAPEEE